MHMADTLISPAVGGTIWVAASGAAAYSIKKLQSDLDEKKIPLMGVMGAFVFAAQMINFSIPGTGSSGHIGGGILLAVFLGPYAGFLTMTAILMIQALFFADGGLLAFGCNVFNLGLVTCLIAYPLIYRVIMRKGLSSKKIFAASMVSVILGLQAGAFGVVIETVLSGQTNLPFKGFILPMQLIHLAIGVAEGLVTAAIVTFVWRARPEIIENTIKGKTLEGVSIKKILVGFSIVAILTAGVFSWFASSKPDGLEWSVSKASDKTELETANSINKTMEKIQNKTALFPNYSVKPNESSEKEASNTESVTQKSSGSSFAGLIGGGMMLLLAVLTGLIIRLIKKNRKRAVV